MFIVVFLRFKTKYHPEECAKRQQEIRKALKRRCEVFMEFITSGRVNSVGCDIERNEELVKLLDAGKVYLLSFRASPLARSPGQVKLVSDK